MLTCTTEMHHDGQKVGLCLVIRDHGISLGCELYRDRPDTSKLLSPPDDALEWIDIAIDYTEDTYTS
jgi:hypothetical protein